MEVFVLIGLASAGSAIVFATMAGYGAASQGPGISIQDGSISQGSGAGEVSLIISNIGTVAAPSFSIAIPGIANAQYYISLTNVANGSPVVASPSSGTVPSLVSENVGVQPGQSLAISLTIVSGSEFTLGSLYSLVVSSTSGAQTQIRLTATVA